MNARPRLTSALFLLVLSVTGVLAVDECQPNCHGHVAGDLVEDPMNCTQFYVCIDKDEPSSHPVACQPPTGVFDPLQGKCVGGDSCEASCASHACHIRCNTTFDVIADTTNCSQYFLCDAAYDPVGPYLCPADKPYFSGKACVENAWQCCKTECTPFCYPGDVQIIDPTDCTKYYICLEEGPPLEANHFTCPSGETFRPSASICVPGAPCLILCDTTTTTTTTHSTTDCITNMTCGDKGNFPMCLSCNPGYFQCDGMGEVGNPTVCDDGFLFNTDPSYPFCVKASECPYTPPP